MAKYENLLWRIRRSLSESGFWFCLGRKRWEKSRVANARTKRKERSCVSEWKGERRDEAIVERKLIFRRSIKKALNVVASFSYAENHQPVRQRERDRSPEYSHIWFMMPRPENFSISDEFSFCAERKMDRIFASVANVAESERFCLQCTDSK